MNLTLDITHGHSKNYESYNFFHDSKRLLFYNPPSCSFFRRADIFSAEKINYIRVLRL